MIRDQYPSIYDEEDISIITIVKKDPLSPKFGHSSFNLGNLISAIYFTRYGLNVFRGEGSVQFSCASSGSWTGGRRQMRHFLTSTPQIPLIGKKKEIRLRAYLGDVFILHRAHVTFIPAETMVSLQVSGTQEKENK